MPPSTTLLGFPLAAWVIIVVEFFERLAYYGAAFTLSTYCTNLLLFTESTTNIVINVLYIVSPLSALIASGVSDGPFGRPRTLRLYLVVYALGLLLIAVSSLPLMFLDFPSGPTPHSIVLFVVGIVLFGTGYGGMKVCTSPLTADAAAEAMGRGGLEEADRQADETTNEKRARISFLFRVIYWSINFGSLFGIICAPLLRGVDARTVQSGSEPAHTGYYAAFFLCAGATSVGSIFFAFCFPMFSQNKPSESFLVFRVFARALYMRLKFMTSVVKDEKFFSANKKNLFAFAFYRPEVRKEVEFDESTEGSHAPTINNDGSIHVDTVEKVQQTFMFCKVFATLPLYWLISNQFSTNVVLQANNMQLPLSVPPEALNNVNTISLLVSVVVLDKWVFPRWYGKRRPCVRSRMTIGFLMVAVSMLWCGVVQLVMDQRGKYDGEGNYSLLDGQQYVSALWLLGPYTLQGIASVFVDTTVLESAYLMAPEEMKSTVMALYLAASSISGFLGIIFSPLAAGNLVGIMFFVLALLQGMMTLLFLRVGFKLPPAEALPLLEDIDATA